MEICDVFQSFCLMLYDFVFVYIILVKVSYVGNIKVKVGRDGQFYFSRRFRRVCDL